MTIVLGWQYILFFTIRCCGPTTSRAQARLELVVGLPTRIHRSKVDPSHAFASPFFLSLPPSFVQSRRSGPLGLTAGRRQTFVEWVAPCLRRPPRSDRGLGRGRRLAARRDCRAGAMSVGSARQSIAAAAAAWTPEHAVFRQRRPPSIPIRPDVEPQLPLPRAHRVDRRRSGGPGR